MVTYLVDYENVQAQGLDGIEALDSNDTVVVFTGAKQNTIPVTLARKLTAASRTARVQWIEVKKQAAQYLDFQLATYLGSLIGATPPNVACTYVVISKDRGYQAVIDFWSMRRQVTISQRATINAIDDAPVASAPDPVKNPVPSAENADTTKQNIRTVTPATRKQIRAALTGRSLAPQTYAVIYKHLAESSSHSEFNQRLQKQKLSQSPEILKALKPVVAKLFQK